MDKGPDAIMPEEFKQRQLTYHLKLHYIICQDLIVGRIFRWTKEKDVKRI